MRQAAGPAEAGKVVIAGIGNPYRHDDAVGLVVSTGAGSFGGVSDIGPVDDPLDLLGRWDGAALAIVVDAVCSGERPGSIRVLELTERETTAPAGEGPAGEKAAPRAARSRPTSSHGVDVEEVLRLARLVSSAPRRVVLVGIEGSDFSEGVGLSEPVGSAVPEALREVIRLVEEFRSCA